MWVVNNTNVTTQPAGNGSQFEEEEAIVLNEEVQTALTVIIGISLPMGLLFELTLIVKLLRKGERRIWDVLMLALEGRRFTFCDRVVDISRYQNLVLLANEGPNKSLNIDLILNSNFVHTLFKFNV